LIEVQLKVPEGHLKSLLRKGKRTFLGIFSWRPTMRRKLSDSCSCNDNGGIDGDISSREDEFFIHDSKLPFTSPSSRCGSSTV
jgi:hypothetical protein